MGETRPGGGPAHLERSITFTGAVALAVGGVVGAGIYKLIAPIGEGAGHALWLAFLCAMAVSLVGVLPLIQLTSALPRAGAGYFFTSRLLTPMAGSIAGFWILLGGASSTGVVSLAFAAYVGEYIPVGLGLHAFAILLVLAFYAVYFIGVRLAIGLQIIMAGQLIVALLIYIAAGLVQVDVTFSVTPPAGLSPFLLTILLCYNTVLGFQILAEMAEEIRDARRTIPRALVASAVLVATMYILVGTIFVSSIPYAPGAYNALQAPLNESALMLLPSWIVVFVNFGAISAALTSLNAAAVALPREIFAQARDGILPRAMGRVNERTHTPLFAVSAYIAVAVLLIALGQDIDFYGYVTALGIQLATTMICIASLRLERRFPEHYAAAYFHVPRWLLGACAVITALVTCGFCALIALERPAVLVLYAALGAGAAVYHRLRTAHLERHGVRWRETVASIPEEGESSYG